MLVLGEEVVEKGDFDKVLLRDQVGIRLRGQLILFLLLPLIVDGISLLCALLEILILDGDKQLSQQFVLLAVVALADNEVGERHE